jgi:hypothetical protein
VTLGYWWLIIQITVPAIEKKERWFNRFGKRIFKQYAGIKIEYPISQFSNFYYKAKF